MIMPKSPAVSTTALATTIFQLGTNLRQPPRPLVGGFGGSGGPPCPPALRERLGGESLTIVSWLLTARVSCLARDRVRGGSSS
jgi:hypothetical protein